jgi:hypothetical protein
MDTGLGSHLRTHSTSTLVDPLTVWDFVSHRLRHPVLAKGLGPPYGRLTAPTALSRARTDLDEVSMFRTWETRLGLGVLCAPRTAVFTRP